MKRCSCKKSSSIKSSNVEKAWNWPRSEKVTVWSISHSTLEQNPGLGIFQRISGFSISSILSRPKGFPSPQIKLVEFSNFWPKWLDRFLFQEKFGWRYNQKYVSLSWMINRKTKTFRFEKNLAKSKNIRVFKGMKRMVKIKNLFNQ